MWTRWALRYGLIPSRVLSAIHGRYCSRTCTPRQRYRCGDRPASFGGREEVDEIVPVAGARELLECLPRDRWAVVTSADRGLPETRMHLAGLPRAPLLVAAEDVQAGKPVPDGYRIAAENLGLDCEATVVFENSDTSILAGRNA
ncbi:MAG: HAD-IA family hydrolase, partial [Pseudomonadota bacterium]|nr:HAD-IA family hydrolase [Pseudomonadota bacterium]